MRGKRVGLTREVAHGRIIPAHAGQTPIHVIPFMIIPDHPRACGANPVLDWRVYLLVGSSPRMRGKPVCVQAFAVRTRIIPAHAGQTMPKMLSIDLCTDHPRACGANAQRDERAATVAGSSPRMRGKRWSRRPRCHSPRIIPAHAGQTPVRPPAAIRPSDHPRACGANSAVDRADQMNNGSSPRMRGKQRHQTGNTGTVRIIPAHAGQTMFHCS